MTGNLALTRVCPAPPSAVFACRLKPDHLVHWYNAGQGWTAILANLATYLERNAP